MGYWEDDKIMAKFLFSVFMDQDGVEVHKLAKNVNEANIKLFWRNRPG